MMKKILGFMVVASIVSACGGDPPSTPSPPPATSPAPQSSLPPIPFGDVVNASCDCFCFTCALGETMVCRQFASIVPKAGAVDVEMEFDAGEAMFMSVSSLGRSVYYSAGQSPLVMRQGVSAGNLSLQIGCRESVEGKKLQVRLRATLEETP